MNTEDKRTPCFEDLDVMPFGKHLNELMQDVPAHYLKWWWTTEENGKLYSKNLTLDNQQATSPKLLEKVKLANYIWNSRSALQEELNDTFI